MLLTTVLITGSFLLCILLTLPVRNLALRLGLVDQPDFGRKIHTVPIPRIGGVPVVLACGGAVAILVLTGQGNTPAADQFLSAAWKLAPALLVIFATGLVDDLIGLNPLQKLGGQILAAVLVLGSGFRFDILAGLGWGPTWDVILTLGWLVACTNAFNLIDGVDGLATGTGLIATLTMLVAAILSGDDGLVLLAAPVVGSLLGFLCFNFNPASIFLGDSGSLSVGFLLGCFGVLLSRNADTLSGMIAPAVALAIPLLDTTLSFARRFVVGKSIFCADRGHIHHRLIERGFTPRRVCLILFAASALVACISLVLSTSPDSVGAVAVVVFGAVTTMGVQSLRYQEFVVLAGLLRKVRPNVKSQLSLQDFERRLREAASPEECWRVVRNVAREFGFAGITLQFGGRRFEERISTNGHGAWNVSLFISPTDYVSLTRQYGTVTAADTVTPLVDLLHKTLSEKAAAFHDLPESNADAGLQGRYLRKAPSLVKTA